MNNSVNDKGNYSKKHKSTLEKQANKNKSGHKYIVLRGLNGTKQIV